MNYKPAKIYSAKNNPEKVWYVYYDYKDKQGNWKRFKVKKDINRIKNLKEKKASINDLLHSTNELLKTGYNPFDKKVTENPLAAKTIKEAVEYALEIKKPSIRTRSVQQYTYSVKKFISFLDSKHYSTLFPSEFTHLKAMEFADGLSGMSNKTFNEIIANVRMIFNMLIDRELLDKNPFKKINLKKLEIGKNIPFTDKQKDRLAKYLKSHNPNLLLFCKFIYHCYARPNEIVQIKVKNLDFEHNRLMIPANISKNRKQSAVEIPDTFIAEVKKAFKGRPEENYLFGKNLECSDKNIIRNRVSEMHSDVLKQLELSGGQTMYSWKHTGVIAAFKAGVDIYDLMRQLRHHSLNQTADYMKSLGLMPNIGFKTKAPKF